MKVIKKMTKTIPFIDLSAQQKRLRKNIQKGIDGVLSHGKYIMGPEVKEFEKKLEDYTNANYAVTCGNGTDALLLSLMAYNIGPGDLVFCPAFTFPATAEVICLLGAVPYFIDVEKDTFNISIEGLNKAIKIATQEKKYNIKAIIAVDLYGLPAEYKSLNNIAKKNNLILIADAAQSFGAEYLEKKVGTLADITCISFFPAKPLGCYGDGGAILTNNEDIASKVKNLRVHGKGKSKYDIDYIGVNSRLDTIQAAVLLSKIDSFEWEVMRRNKIAKRYSEFLSNDYNVPFIPKGYNSIWAQYTIKHENRDEIQGHLKSQGIPTMIYYPVPMHLQNAYKKYYRGPLVNSEKLAKQVFSIPMYPDMSEEDQEYIISNMLKSI